MGSFSCELYAYLYRFAGMHTDLDIALGKISLILANLGYTWRVFVSVQNLILRCRSQMWYVNIWKQQKRKYCL